MKLLFVFDTPNEALFEWLPLLRDANQQVDATAIALDPALFPIARWACPNALLRPVTFDLCSPVPPRQSLDAFLRHLDVFSPDTVCVLNGRKSYVYDHVRASFVKARIVRAILNDINGDTPSDTISTTGLSIRGISELEVLSQSLGLRPNVTDFASPPSKDALGRVSMLLESFGEPVGHPYVILAFGPTSSSTLAVSTAVDNLIKPLKKSGYQLIRLQLLEAGRAAKNEQCEPVAHEVNGPDFALLAFTSSGVITNNYAVAHLCAQVGRSCLSIWAGKDCEPHMPRAKTSVSLGTCVPIFPTGDFPTLILMERFAAAIERLVPNGYTECLKEIVPASLSSCIEYMDVMVEEMRGATLFGSDAQVEMSNKFQFLVASGQLEWEID